MRCGSIACGAGIELGKLLGEDVERYKEWLREALQAAKRIPLGSGAEVVYQRSRASGLLCFPGMDGACGRMG